MNESDVLSRKICKKVAKNKDVRQVFKIKIKRKCLKIKVFGQLALDFFLTKIKTSDVFEALNCICLTSMHKINGVNGEKIYNIAKTVRRIYNKTIKINQTITGEMEESK